VDKLSLTSLMGLFAVLLSAGLLSPCWGEATQEDLGRQQEDVVAMPEPGPLWRTDYDEARLEALRKYRPLLLLFTTEECFWTKKLAHALKGNLEVEGLLREELVAVKVNGENNPSLATSWGVTCYPTILVLDRNDKVISRLEGFREAKKLAEEIRMALQQVRSAE
jgi:hypothetical protein